VLGATGSSPSALLIQTLGYILHVTVKQKLTQITAYLHHTKMSQIKLKYNTTFFTRVFPSPIGTIFLNNFIVCNAEFLYLTDDV
jgi:hypothetical protein